MELPFFSLNQTTNPSVHTLIRQYMKLQSSVSLSHSLTLSTVEITISSEYRISTRAKGAGMQHLLRIMIL